MPSLELSPLFEFSRQNCVAICAFLVPANLGMTIQTLLLGFFGRPQWQLRASVGIGAVFGMTMILHVATWFAIGVVTPITFILIGLASLCLTVNGLTLAFSRYYRHYFSLWVMQFRHTVYQALHG